MPVDEPKRRQNERKFGSWPPLSEGSRLWAVAGPGLRYPKPTLHSLAAAAFLTMWACLMGAIVAVPPAASAQTADAVIAGQLVNGTAGAPFDPTKVPVTLNVLEGVTAIDQRSMTPDRDGAFAFAVPVQQGRTYFLTAEYRGAVYSASRAANSLTEPVALTVYESTADPSVLSVDSYTIVVTGAAPDERFVEILEQVRVRNASDRTLVPDFAGQGPAMLSFLRFALPPNATNLDVESTLVGGDVIEVDRGFAVTTPIPPTPDQAHLFRFVYRLAYDGPSLDLSRTLRFGAGTIRVVVPEEVASLTAPQLTDLGATPLDGRSLRLFEGLDIAPGEALTLHIDGLPQPSLWSRVSQPMKRLYLTAAAPALLGLALTALLAWGIARGRRLRKARSGGLEPGERRSQAHTRLAEIEASYTRGEVSRRRYLREREEIRETLLELAQREQFSDQPTEPA